jgi:hypothetical protein
MQPIAPAIAETRWLNWWQGSDGEHCSTRPPVPILDGDAWAHETDREGGFQHNAVSRHPVRRTKQKKNELILSL